MKRVARVIRGRGLLALWGQVKDFKTSMSDKDECMKLNVYVP